MSQYENLGLERKTRLIANFLFSDKEIMFNSLVKTIVRRSLVIFVLLQAGFILAIYVIAQLANDSNIYGTTNWYLLLSALGFLALAVFLSVFFILSPIYSLMQKIKELILWRDWLLNELPKFVAMLPTIIKAIREGFEGFKSADNNETPKDSVRAETNTPSATEVDLKNE